MLSTFRVKNFKAFSDTDEISVKPLSILSGINSAGKSSIIQSLLLLKQTIGSERALNLQGDLMPSKINFDELVHNKPELDEAQLEYILKFCYEEDSEETRFLFDSMKRVATQLNIPLLETSNYVNLTLTLKFENGAYGFVGRPTERVTELTFDLTHDDVPIGKIHIATTQKGGYKVKVIKEGSPVRLYDEAKLAVDGLTNFLPSSLIFEGETNGWQLSFGQMFRQLMTLIRVDLSDNLNYLSSFRTGSRRAYLYDPSSFAVAKDGGNFASVFWNLRHEQVSYFYDEQVTKSLEELTYSVLRQVGLKQKVEIRKIDAGIELIIVELDTLNNRDVKVTLPDVGQGYNQILPIIIQGLITPENGLVIFEQPEIHLHPNIQSQLIQFFIGLARSGRNVLVETHSSHLIDHLQLEIVRDYSNWVQNNSQLLFVHPPQKYKPSAETKIVEVDTYGAIEYPPKFLPDTFLLDDEIIRAGFDKRRIEREN